MHPVEELLSLGRYVVVCDARLISDHEHSYEAHDEVKKHEAHEGYRILSPQRRSSEPNVINDEDIPF